MGILIRETSRKGIKMQSFKYTIKDELGMHARPAGLVVTEAKKYSSVITVRCGEKCANATRLMAVMALGVKCGQEVTISAEGDDEKAAIEGLMRFFEATL